MTILKTGIKMKKTNFITKALFYFSIILNFYSQNSFSLTSSMANKNFSNWKTILIQNQEYLSTANLKMSFNQINIKNCYHRIKIKTLHPKNPQFTNQDVLFGTFNGLPSDTLEIKEFIYPINLKVYYKSEYGNDDFDRFVFTIPNKIPVQSRLLFGAYPNDYILSLWAVIYRDGGGDFHFNDGKVFGGNAVSSLFYGPDYVTYNSIILEQSCMIQVTKALAKKDINLKKI